MTNADSIKKILGEALNLGARAEMLQPSSALLGAIPEFDSMAVVTVLTMIEDEYDITIDDDEVSADVFKTLGTLTDFVATKVGR
jgi:acyl carrier protein